MARLSVTDIVRIRYCERLPRMDARYGKRRSIHVQKRAAEGVAAHAKFETNNHPDSRCFIATHIYGHDNLETNIFREYRDRILLKQWHGRLLVRLYYLVSPGIVCFIRNRVWLQKIMRHILDGILNHIAIENRALPSASLWSTRKRVADWLYSIFNQDKWLSQKPDREIQALAATIIDSFPTIEAAKHWVISSDNKSIQSAGVAWADGIEEMNGTVRTTRLFGTLFRR